MAFGKFVSDKVLEKMAIENIENQVVEHMLTYANMAGVGSHSYNLFLFNYFNLDLKQ